MFLLATWALSGSWSLHSVLVLWALLSALPCSLGSMENTSMEDNHGGILPWFWETMDTVQAVGQFWLDMLARRLTIEDCNLALCRFPEFRRRRDSREMGSEFCRHHKTGMLGDWM